MRGDRLSAYYRRWTAIPTPRLEKVDNLKLNGKPCNGVYTEFRLEREGSVSSTEYECVIALDSETDGQTRLNTIAHEFLHHLLPGVGHKLIRRLAGQLSAFLWADGWRRREG